MEWSKIKRYNPVGPDYPEAGRDYVLRSEAEERLNRECEWHTHDADWNCWLGTCGIEWMLEVDGPVENEMNYCPRCGGKLIVREGE